MLNKNEIYYSMGGLPQYFDSLEEMFEYKINKNINEIILNTSSQPNSIPHLGTLTTLMSVFCLAKRLKAYFKLPVSVEFDEIECSPGNTYDIKGSTYIKPISDSIITTQSIADENMLYYYQIMEQLKELTKIDYRVRTYQEFQSLTIIREGLLKVVNDRDYFLKLFNPKDNKLHIRSKCPICSLVDKNMVHTKIDNITSDSFTLSSHCGNHGFYNFEFEIKNNTYVEMNTQLRDLLKGYLIDYSYNNEKKLIAMIDGGDWGGTWATRIHCEGMQKLWACIPIRLFTPLILDRSGGKLSKSHYLNGKSYSYVKECYNDFVSFYNFFGQNGFYKLFKEVETWVAEPKKFFRNYSIDYIDLIMEGK